MSKQTQIYKSLQIFLFRKTFVSEAVMLLAKSNKEVWNNVFDEAYKSYATHRLGIAQPTIPTNLFQVDERILDDQDWLFVDTGEEDEVNNLEDIVNDAMNSEPETEADSEPETEAEVDSEPEANSEAEAEPEAEKGE